MVDFGWSYPPGCSGTPYDDDNEQEDKVMTKYEKICPICDGSGVVYNHRWREHKFDVEQLAKKYQSEGMSWLEAEEKAFAKLKHLEPDELEELPCEFCEGKGIVPTEEGLEILRFVQKYIDFHD